jgi:tetratricopeptide (TPR) repeat protein
MPGNYWYKEAEEAFKKVISIKGKEDLIGESHYYLAQISYVQKKYEDARTEIDMAVRNNPDNAEYHFLAAKIYKFLDMLDEAESEIKLSVELDAENEEYQKLLREIIKLKIQKERGLKGSQEDLEPGEDGEGIIGEDYKTLVKRGLNYIKREGYDNALEVFRNAAESNPGGIEAHNNMGSSLLHKEKLNEALVEFMVCESINPKDAEIHINLAIAYYFIADYKNAKEEYLKATAINSEFSKDTLYIILIENGTVPAKDFLPKIIWKTPK